MALVEYLDFEIEIGLGQGREYPLVVIRSPGGEARERMVFPFDELALESRLKDLQIALLRSGGKRRQTLSSEESTVQEFGQKLFDALLSGEIRSRYDVSQREADQHGKGLRIKLRIQPPELASLPWEFLYDRRRAEYICLSTQTPLVRYIELPQVIQPLTVAPPLRILGLTASPIGLARLDVENEKQRMEKALEELIATGQVQITWLEHANRRELQRCLRRGSWHILHFIGHGGFDPANDEGFIALESEQGELDRMPATQLARLLANYPSLRLAVLNSCEGAQGGRKDVFSSTASLLVRRGIPAVLAMQYAITDRAAIEFARGFYEALADDLPVDAATAEARISVSLSLSNTIEWGTPVLFMRGPDGILFKHLSPDELIRLEAKKAARARVEQEMRASEQAERVAAELAQQQKVEEELAEKLAAEKLAAEKMAGERLKQIAHEQTASEAAEKAAREQAEADDSSSAPLKTETQAPRKQAIPAWLKTAPVIMIVLVVCVLLASWGLSALAGALTAAQPTPTEKPLPVASFTPIFTPEATLTVTMLPPTLSFTSTPVFTPVPTSLPVEMTDFKGVTMRLVPAGEFTMGDKADDAMAECRKFVECYRTWFTNEEPPHTVSLDAYYMDVYEVTNALYKACVDAGACTPPQDKKSYTHAYYYGNPQFDKYPVIYVNWNQSKTYCEWRGARLPTEAEWEKAARGTDQRTYPWGKGVGCSKANYVGCKGDTTPVGSYPGGVSPYGMYDMAGNVWEWTADWYVAYPGNTTSNSDFGTQYRVRRGGSWSSVVPSMRASGRDRFPPGDWGRDWWNDFNSLGFRCAR